jgi:3-oxosteroid 1-dehydrogenase
MKGLYAVEKNSASVIGSTYTGARATLGPAMSSAYITANHIAGRWNEL